jgi:FkbM family methyltransferase
MFASTSVLRHAVFRHWAHHTAGLPYNLNWAIRLSAEEREYLRACQLVVCDVGARGTAPSELEPFHDVMTYYAFDADADECARLNASRHPYAAFRAFPHFIGAHQGEQRFHLYLERSHSSSYLPDPRYQAAFGGAAFDIDETVTVSSIPLDTVLGAEALAPPDMLKLDVQGSELGVLAAAPVALETAHLVEVEVSFLSLYENQPLFADVLTFMGEHGYELLYLNRVFGQRREVYGGPARGQLVFGDALFGRREDLLGNASDEQLVKYVLLLINYGHIDFARQLVLTFPRISAALPAIERRFSDTTHGSAGGRAAVSQIDKLAMLWLHWRRYNRLNTDSDRSWPTR